MHPTQCVHQPKSASCSLGGLWGQPSGHQTLHPGPAGRTEVGVPRLLYQGCLPPLRIMLMKSQTGGIQVNLVPAWMCAHVMLVGGGGACSWFFLSLQHRAGLRRPEMGWQQKAGGRTGGWASFTLVVFGSMGLTVSSSITMKSPGATWVVVANTS